MRPRIGCKVWQLVEAPIQEEWCPEQIVGRLEEGQGACIGNEWIYHQAAVPGGGRLKRYSAYSRRGMIPDQVSNNARPAIVDS